MSDPLLNHHTCSFSFGALVCPQRPVIHLYVFVLLRGAHAPQRPVTPLHVFALLRGACAPTKTRHTMSVRIRRRVFRLKRRVPIDQLDYCRRIKNQEVRWHLPLSLFSRTRLLVQAYASLPTLRLLSRVIIGAHR